MEGLIGGIIGLAIVVIVFSTVLMTTIIGTNVTAWTTSEQSLWQTTGLVAVVGVLVLMLRVFGVEA